MMDGLLGDRRDLADGWARMEDAARESGLDPALMTWSAARVRQLLGIAVDCPVDTPEPAVADFVEMFFLDVHAVTDEQARAAATVLGDSLFVALVVWLGITESRARMEAMIG